MTSKHIHAEDVLLRVDSSIRLWAYNNAYTLIFCAIMMISILAIWCGITLTTGSKFG